MKITLLAFGSRGDVQPILSLSDALVDAGYTVEIGAATNFQSWIEGRGHTYRSLDIDMHHLLNSDMGKAWIEESANSAQEARNMKRVLDATSEAVSEAMLAACQDADVLLSNLPTFGQVQAIAEKFGKRHIRVMLAPLTPSLYPEATMFPLVPWRKNALNRLSGYLGIYFMYWINQESTNAFRRRLGLSPWGYGDFARAWNQMPVLYGVSPRFLPRDEHWRADTIVTGYWYDWHDKPPIDWQPPPALEQFLTDYPAPVYIGFGSMAAKNPQQTLATFIDALEQTGKPGIIYSGWAGLQTEQVPPQVLLIDDAPHAWLFPRMAALIHHGGAGTTATGAWAGVPATVVSHMADQPYWGRRLYELGIGARPMRRQQLSAHRLAQAIHTMTATPQMQQRAQKLAQEVRGENGVGAAIQAIDKILDNS